MDVEVSDETLMFRDATRAFLESRGPLSRVRELTETPEGFDRDAWTEGAALGWTAMLAPEAYGGAGLDAEGVIAAATLAEELGRMLQPGPFLPVNVVVDALVRSGSDAHRAEIVPALVDGSRIATWAVADGADCWRASDVRTLTTPSGRGYAVTGTKEWVQDGQNADLVLVTCRDDDGRPRQLLVPTDAAGVTITPLETMDLGRRLARIRFDAVQVDADAVVGTPGDADTIDRQLRLAVVLQCAESVGATARMLERSVVYAKERIAFGRPIGSFQAVKHHLAEALTLLEAAQAATWGAVRAVASDAADAADAARAVHVAKVFVGTKCPHAVEMCMQVHGGIAMTWEDDSHLFLRRVQSNRMLFGSPTWHADRLCDVVGVAA